MQAFYRAKRSVVMATALTLMALALPSITHAQVAWPARPITIVVPGAAGGTIDIPIRLLAQKLSARVGQPVVVDNRPGSGGIIGTQAALRAPADGYTLLAGNVGPQAINYSAYKRLTYQPSDLTAVTDIIAFPNVLVVNARSPVRSVADLVAQLKQQPGKLSFGSAGIGQTSHLVGELFKLRTGTDAIHVPYKGSTPATTALLAEETSFQFDNLTQALPYIRAGKLRALAVTARQRMPSLPEVPTMEQAGFDNFLSTAWIGIFVSAKTPQGVVSDLERQLAAVMRDPDLQEQIRQMGGIPGGQSPEKFAAFVASERDRWGEVIRASHMTLD
ncbi:tripartite tricarboxylate transporter substrate binding protein [Cupriavidus sp. WKF15]|uniref:Bug family tripartite tricarboxylate transporter substrate binding protein n=1 Tax=Cupriavidus sp. WKF15 TaxID=3032282 RepID=UPI0023E108F2|nr:tripartite tricarboxylate transporter substrate binding protein [Cupriavidus sp. WKF15]WER45686.1 tripartite tricarboxylate transporter substrate binding protein [Cupriavidus sp. WKF15]